MVTPCSAIRCISNDTRMKIGICGGTFDPFHRGHLDPILAVRDVMQWDRLLYVPARRQPFKVDRDTAPASHRYAMAVLATEAFAFIWISPWEIERDAVSFTVDTLEHLQSENPGATLDWIIGDDNVAQLGGWKSLGRILELANFVVLSREGQAVMPGVHDIETETGLRIPVLGDAASRGIHGSIVLARNAMIPISSTEIRKRTRAGQPIDSFVDPRVARYIDHNGLYRAS